MSVDPKGESKTTAPVEVRNLSSPGDYESCVKLQRLTWGEEFTDVVTPITLMLTQKVGGVAAGAFAPDGEMAGFVYGLTGFRDGSPVHWSHMLAVRPEYESAGVGRKLKHLQREQLLAGGIVRMSWSYDPLVARNAHLNLNRLGAQIIEYVPDMYGTDTGSVLHCGLGTDRFVVEWLLQEPGDENRASDALPGVDAEDVEAPVVNTERSGHEILPAEGDLPDVPNVRIEIPEDIEDVKAISMELGMRWRSCTRRACQWYLAREYAVCGFHRDTRTGRCFYLLARYQGETK